MAIVGWSKGTRSSNILGTVADGLANTVESASITYDASAGVYLYAAVTLKLGTVWPVTGGQAVLRVTINDGTDTSDKVGGDLYPMALTAGSSTKTVILPRIQLHPFSLRLSLINLAGAAFAGSGNQLFLLPYTEAG
jgi:hypothetical protein